jgi:RimJ/RimL family protein N-acetyltransferase
LNITFVEPSSSEHFQFFWETRQASSPFLHDKSSFSLGETTDFLKKNSQNYILASIDDTLVGYFRCVIVGDLCKIGADLSEKFRGKGYARPLYSAFVREFLVPRGVENLELRVLRSNIRAKNLYDSMGFKVTEATSTDFEMGCKLQDLIETLRELSV